MTIKNDLAEIFKARQAGPFLFVGSGFSRRYLGLEDWRGLLSRFCVTGRPFEYYLAEADGYYPTLARILASEFNKYWWQAEEFKESVTANQENIKNSTSALRIEIANYLQTLDQSVAKVSEYANEVELLAGLNVDGVITTNWDLFLEEIFPDYKVYVGQEELLFSNPQEIGEIYKIHGCCSRPESLILTDDDYREFNNRNAYLAAKLITLFVEHPILFIGYSISDPNITGLLRSISQCIGAQNLEQLRRNLIFIQRLDGREAEGITDTYLTIDGIQIPMVLVKTDDLSPIYQAIDENKRKIPARVLRFCKEQLFELVKSATPETKLSVVGIDELDDKGDIEFVVGIGVASRERENTLSKIGALGYKNIMARDLQHDLLHNDKGFDPEQVLTHVIPNITKFTDNVPVYKYLAELGIQTAEAYENSPFNLGSCVSRPLTSYATQSYKKAFERRHQRKNIQELVRECTSENAAAFIPFLPKESLDADILLHFLIENEDKLDPQKSNYVTFFRKLAALYDRVRWGW